MKGQRHLEELQEQLWRPFAVKMKPCWRYWDKKVGQQHLWEAKAMDYDSIITNQH